MALSDYECVGFNKDAECITPVFKYGDWTFELYKSWMYVHDKKHKDDKNKQFTDDVIGRFYTTCEMEFGPVKLMMKEFKATADHGRGMFFLIEYFMKKNNRYMYQYQGGIACSAYRDKYVEILADLNLTHLLTDEASISYGSSNYPILESLLSYKKGIPWVVYLKFDGCWYKFSRGRNWVYSIDQQVYDYISTNSSDHITISSYTKKDRCIGLTIIEPGEGWDKDSYVGITPEMMNEYVQFVKDSNADKTVTGWLKKLSKTSVVKYNQGDAFLSSALGKSLPVSKPGDNVKSMMSTMIDEIKESENGK